MAPQDHLLARRLPQTILRTCGNRTIRSEWHRTRPRRGLLSSTQCQRSWPDTPPLVVRISRLHCRRTSQRSIVAFTVLDFLLHSSGSPPTDDVRDSRVICKMCLVVIENVCRRDPLQRCFQVREVGAGGAKPHS